MEASILYRRSTWKWFYF